jgi:HemY protein
MIIWLLLVSMVAVLAATVLGANDGLVSVYWLGWRVDFSLNLFVLGLVLACLLTYMVIRGFDGLWHLPVRAQQWRTTQRDKAAQAALREALSFYLAARYARAHKAAQKATYIQAETQDIPADAGFTALSHLLSAGSLHRLRDRTQRDAHLQLALSLSKNSIKLKPLEEGARLLSAEFALDDRAPHRALQELATLPAGIARRTQALRIKLSAARLANQPIEALRAARLLAKHQGFSPAVAQGLLRSLARDVLNTTRDADQLQTAWQQLDSHEKSDPFIVADAAMRMSQLGHPETARIWLSPLWDGIEKQAQDATQALAHAMRSSLHGLEASWLPRLDRVAQSALRIPALGLCVGLALSERQLWGKARTFLLSAANDQHLDREGQRVAWVALAELAEKEHSNEEAAKYWKAAATLQRPPRQETAGNL